MINVYVEKLIERYPILDISKKRIIDAYYELERAFLENKKVLIAGNGGSAADAEHMAGELMKRFQKPRPISEDLKRRILNVDSIRGKELSANLEKSLRAIPLVAHEAMITAYMNDVDAKGVFAQQLLGYGDEGDVFIAISTSGNSENIINAAIVARALGIRVIALTGATGGELKKYADITICVPERETYIVQEYHLPIYHCLCAMLEERFFNENSYSG